MRVLVLVATGLLFVNSPAYAFSPLKDGKSRFGVKTAMPRILASTATETEKELTDKDLNDVFAANKAWIDNMKAGDPKFFDTLGSVHKPDYVSEAVSFRRQV